VIEKKTFCPAGAERAKAVLVGLVTQQQDERKAAEYLDELAFLADTAGIATERRFTQRVPYAYPKTYVGTGKLQEINGYIKEHEIGTVIFDDELSPSQLRNIERALECSVLDRTALILTIFAQRAKTAYAKTQVELAQYQYLLPRLTRLWTHLERQRGGGVTMRGPGETQIETDRRIVLSKIALLKEQLKKVDRQMAAQRGNRGGMVRLALVGYTNVGKSTIMNLLAKSDVFAENKLFATLDTTVRKVVVEQTPFLLSDTVGFIRKLPHQLVEAFKSTLDEVREADALLHVVDVAHPNFEEQINVVRQTLHEIGARDKPTYMVFNKMDAYTFAEPDPYEVLPVEREPVSLEALQRTWMDKVHSPSVFISAKERINIEPLRRGIFELVTAVRKGS
jgi:GTP-binding protein HflX